MRGEPKKKPRTNITKKRAAESIQASRQRLITGCFQIPAYRQPARIHTRIRHGIADTGTNGASGTIPLFHVSPSPMEKRSLSEGKNIPTDKNKKTA